MEGNVCDLLSYVEILREAEGFGRHLNLREVLVDGWSQVVEGRGLKDDTRGSNWNNQLVN